MWPVWPQVSRKPISPTLRGGPAPCTQGPGQWRALLSLPLPGWGWGICLEGLSPGKERKGGASSCSSGNCTGTRNLQSDTASALASPRCPPPRPPDRRGQLGEQHSSASLQLQASNGSFEQSPHSSPFPRLSSHTQAAISAALKLHLWTGVGDGGLQGPGLSLWQ